MNERFNETKVEICVDDLLIHLHLPYFLKVSLGVYLYLKKEFTKLKERKHLSMSFNHHMQISSSKFSLSEEVCIMLSETNGKRKLDRSLSEFNFLGIYSVSASNFRKIRRTFLNISYRIDVSVIKVIQV